MNRAGILIAIAFVAGAAGVVVYLGRDRQSPDTAAPPLPTVAADARVSVATVPVGGMSCAACVASVRNGLGSVDGVTGVEVNLAGREAKVEYDEEKVSPDQIVNAINKLGYTAGEPKVKAAK